MPNTRILRGNTKREYTEELYKEKENKKEKEIKEENKWLAFRALRIKRKGSVIYGPIYN